MVSKGKVMKKTMAGLAAAVMALTVFQMTPAAAFAGSDAWDGSADYSWYDPAAEVYHISSPEELAGLANIVNDQAGDIDQCNFSGKTIYLDRDLDLGIEDPKNAEDWVPIGFDVNSQNSAENDFRGTFDGQGNTISLPVTGKVYAYNTGLFAHVYHGTIRDLTLDLDYSDEYKGSSEYHGGLAVHATGCTFSNITIGGTVSVGYNFGGVAYESIGSSFRDCTNNASITAAHYTVGGICAITSQTTSPSTFTRCVNNGNIVSGRQSDTTYYVNDAGGILGFSGSYGSYSDKVDQCENNGDITAGDSKATVTGQGGIVGGCYQGGSSCALSITNCYNIGNITAGTGSYGSGGILGANDSPKIYIKNCYNAGSIKNQKYCGGIAGYMPSDKVSAAMTVNNWYLYRSADSGVGTISDITGIYERFASSSRNNYSELIDALGELYTADYHEGRSMAHGGYPVLTWQAKEDTYAAIFNISHSFSQEDEDHTVTVGITDKEGREVSSFSQTIKDGGSLYASLPAGDYDYLISEDGYQANSGALTIEKANVTSEISLTAVYPAVFTLEEGVDLALYRIEGDQEVLVQPESREDGIVTYLLKNGSYGYNASREGYQEQAWYDPDNQFRIEDQGLDKTVTMKSLLDVSRESAKAEIAGYLDQEDYYLDQKKEIQAIIAEFEEIIDSDESSEAITGDTARAKALLAQVKTCEYIDNEGQIRNVVSLIDKIGEVTELSPSVKGAISRARTAYKALSEGAKAQMAETRPEACNSLTAAEEAYSRLYQQAAEEATPGQISGLTVTAAYNSVQLDWQGDEKALEYRIYRAASAEGDFSLIATVGNVSSYRDTGLTSGSEYFYRIQGIGEYDGQSLEGPVSDTVMAIPDLQAVEGLKLVSGKRCLKISWSSLSDADHYQVSVSTSKTKTVYASKYTNKLKLTKKKLKKGKKYYVKVRAVAPNGYAGPWTLLRSAKVK